MMKDSISIFFPTYLKYLECQKQYSKHTLRAYLYELTIFDSFLEQHNLIWTELHPKDISQWLEYIHKQKLSPRSISRNLSVLRNFFNYLVLNEKITTNPFVLFTAPKSQKKIPFTLSPKDMLELLESMPTSTILQRRNKCLLIIMYTTGVRAEEICHLTLDRVLLIQKRLKILGKGNKERMIPLLPISCTYLEEWLRERSILDKHGNNYVFLSKNGKSLTTNMIAKIIDQESKFSLKKSMHPHAFRYTFATHLLDNNANLRYIQELLGHANLSVTQRYTKISISNLKNKFEQFHPRA